MEVAIFANARSHTFVIIVYAFSVLDANAFAIIESFETVALTFTQAPAEVIAWAFSGSADAFSVNFESADLIAVIGTDAVLSVETNDVVFITNALFVNNSSICTASIDTFSFSQSVELAVRAEAGVGCRIISGTVIAHALPVCLID